MFKRIDTVFLPVSNLDRSLEWYQTNLGLTLRWRYQNYACLNVGETPITLVETEQVTPPTHEPFNLLAPELEAVHARLRDLGLAVSDIRDHGDVQELTVKDPDGTPISIVRC